MASLGTYELGKSAGNVPQQPWSSDPAQGWDAALAPAPGGEHTRAARTGEGTGTGAGSAHTRRLPLLTPLLSCSGFTGIEPAET